MPVSVPLSYEYAVYFVIKNVHFILDSVLAAEWPHEAAPSIYHMICYVLFVKELCCFVCFSNSLFLQNFSRSPYLDNHSSESTHTWTIGTL